MVQYDLVQVWLDNVARAHSNSRSTAYNYARNLRMFCKFAGTTPEQVRLEYTRKDYDERLFKAKYRELLQAWISSFKQADITTGTVSDRVTGVRSFFKYNDMPIGFMPDSKYKVVYSNRDIEKEEIQAIIGVSKARERAFYAFMVQGGLRPDTICKLQFENLEPLETVPCKIMVPSAKTKGEYADYFTFIGEDAVRFLKEYLATRKKKGSEDYVFMNAKETLQLDRTIPSKHFRMAAKKLRTAGSLQYKTQKAHRPSELRLYNLRKYFRKYANQMGFEHVNFLMGHTTPGSDSHYTPQDPEFYRKLYQEKAAPFLRLEGAAPTETEQEIKELRNKIEMLEDHADHLQGVIEEYGIKAGDRLPPKEKEDAEVLDAMDKLADALGATPDNRKQVILGMVENIRKSVEEHMKTCPDKPK